MIRQPPRSTRSRSSAASEVDKRQVLITGASSGIGRATALKVAEAGGIPLLVARSVDKLEQTRQEIEDLGGDAYVYAADISDPESVVGLCEHVLADHPGVDVLVNNAGRSIRRSVALSYDRFHDFERTIRLNYLGTIKLIMGLLPQPKHIGTRLGTLGEVAYTLAPKAVDQILSTAYKVFPDSAAARGEKDPGEHASSEQVALAHLMRGVHW